MRLKKISMIGFKSFADKTTLNFDAGITCIVGPNGCGKSNIADAFRWVLGEQSAKSLRGAKMPDVIFAGTTHRQPLNYAEVSLTLTEVQGALPIDYDEVTLTRRLHRSGESEYFLNQNLVRLKDLQALFLGSGVGRNAFSIFEQGKLDQVISYSPYERRYIFEEAAGIVRFLQRKKEALKRLEQADLNLSRVQDIHREVEKHIQTLETQAKHALVFKENQLQLAHLEKVSYALRWQALEKKRIDLTTTLLKIEEKLTLCKEQHTQQLQETLAFKQLIHQQDRDIRLQSEKRVALKGQQELLAHECQTQQQRLQEAYQREKRLKRDLEELELARRTQQKTLKEIQTKRQQLELEWSSAETDLTSQQIKVKNYEDELSQLRQQTNLKHQSYVKLFQEESEWQNQLKQTELQLTHLQEKETKTIARSQQIKGETEQFAELIKEKKKQLNQASALVDTYKDRLMAYEEELKKISQEREKVQSQTDLQRKQLVEGQARQKVLLKMREDYEGFSSGSQRLLQETKNSKSPLYQTLRPLYEYLQPQPEWAEAIASILRPYAQTLIVEKQSDFQRVLDFATQYKLQEFSLICLEWITNQDLKPLPATWQDKINSHPLSQHFLQEISLSSSATPVLSEQVLQQLLTDGSFVDYRGVWFKTKLNENQLFLRESELQALAEELTIKEEEVAKLEQLLQVLQTKRTQAQLERSELDKMLRRDEMKLVEINFGLQRALADLGKNREEQEQCQKDSEMIQQQIKQYQESYQTLDQQHSKAKAELINIQEVKELLQEELVKQETFIRLQLQDQKVKGEAYQQLAESRQQLHHQSQLIESKEQDHERQVNRLMDELAETAELQVLIRQKEQEEQKKLVKLTEALQEATQILAEQELKGQTTSQQLEQLEKSFALISDELKKLEQDQTQWTMQVKHQQAVGHALILELQERHQLTIEEVQALPAPAQKSIEQVDRQIRQLRQTLQEAGNVNLTAIEELEKHQVRYNFLKQQMDDMGTSKADLLAIIQQLDQESRELFKTTFEQIQANFRKNFQILFNGGEADLQFTTETKDILEAGIEITAKPPGKQMRSISLLSGGEKCLTAVALLFALFEVKPAPFCILDEIDAPLDDTNVERFLNVVKHFVDRCQFLIITHNKRTMAIGDVLFGVSMEEKGVSKLLSLEFAHQTNPKAALV
jgi:chromosome segregation protein